MTITDYIDELNEMWYYIYQTRKTDPVILFHLLMSAVRHHLHQMFLQKMSRSLQLDNYSEAHLEHSRTSTTEIFFENS